MEIMFNNKTGNSINFGWCEASSLASCCGILELSELVYHDEGERYFDGEVDYVFESAKERNEALSERMAAEFGDYPMVILTDVAKNDSAGMKMFKLFNHPNWTKKLIKSERKNPNSGNMLMMGVFIRKA